MYPEFSQNLIARKIVNKVKMTLLLTLVKLSFMVIKARVLRFYNLNIFENNIKSMKHGQTTWNTVWTWLLLKIKLYRSEMSSHAVPEIAKIFQLISWSILLVLVNTVQKYWINTKTFHGNYVCISDLIFFVLRSIIGMMGTDNNNKMKSRVSRVFKLQGSDVHSQPR